MGFLLGVSRDFWGFPGVSGGFLGGFWWFSRGV